MKKILALIIVVVFSSNSIAQKNKGSITLNDGTVLNGFVKTTKNNIVFKKTLESKAVKYDFKKAKSAEITNMKNVTTIFEFVPVEYKKTPLLLRVEIDGFLRMYSESTTIFNNVSNGGSVGSFRDTSTYHIKRKNDEFGQYYVAFGYIPKVSFNKVIEEYFNDCPNLQKKVKKGELKKNDYAEIVMFYNENCAPKE